MAKADQDAPQDEGKEILEITANKSTEGGEALSATVHFDAGDTIAEAAEKFGEQIVYDLFTSALVVKAQAVIRRMLVAGKSQDEIAEYFKSWRPDVKAQVKRDPVSAARASVQKLSEEDRKALLEELLNG